MTKTISLKNITHSFIEKLLLDEVSFKFTSDDRVCIVGDNGTGKSTLLKIIVGEIEQDEGSVVMDSHSRRYYVPQEFPKADLNTSVEEFIKKYASVSVLKKLFSISVQLGFDLEKVLTTQCISLSGGQQKVLALSVGISMTPDFLLLDEPENHLDIVSRMELIKVLQNYRGGVLFVSHDRMIIDAVATKVAEVADKKVFISEGAYQDYIDSRLSRIAGLQRNFDSDSKRIKQLELLVPMLAQKALRGKDVASYLKRKEELKEMKEYQKANPRADDTRTKIKLVGSSSDLHNGKLLCRIDKACFSYENKEIFKDITLDMRTGSHIVLLGRNGSGKSTFLNSITGNLKLASGSVVWADNLKTSYFDQHAEFDVKKEAMQIISEALICDENKARIVLGAMKFTPEKMKTKVGELSGGERMRLRFALVFGGNPDFIILDEPTNNLDEVTWQILLNACNESSSTILLVTHDHEFIAGLESKVFWLIKNKTIQERHKDLDQVIDELR